ncbi:MAG: Na+/H+ antiporter NhaA [Myxococcota bacterium]
MSGEKPVRVVSILQEFSIPLLVGAAVALLAANLANDGYQAALHWMPFGPVSLIGHEVTLHFLVNDVFMVFFFAIAAKEITEGCLPGGSLNPIRKAINPLMATVGGVVGPALVFFLGLWLLFESGVYDPEVDDWFLLARGWGVPTATDIALAWLVARTIFGRGHPAVNFLLLLAVADDAIGLVIIAVFYGDPELPTRPEFLGLIVAGMAASYALRRLEARSWLLYVLAGGPLAWCGLVLAHLHPALALVFIVPFMPGPRRDTGLFAARDEVDELGPALARDLHLEHSTLDRFERHLKGFVDFGLFFFAFANAGVPLTDVGPMTWLILASLVIGKTLGVTLFGLLAIRLGFPLPDRMGFPELAMAGFIAALGLTVALFLASAAFTDPLLLGQVKMGALFSGFVGLVAIGLGRRLGLGPAGPRQRAERSRLADGAAAPE